MQNSVVRMFVSSYPFTPTPSNQFICQNFIPSVMVLIEEVVTRSLKFCPHRWDQHPSKGSLRVSVSHTLCGWSWKVPSWQQAAHLSRQWLWFCLDLRLPASNTLSNKIPLFIHDPVWGIHLSSPNELRNIIPHVPRVLTPSKSLGQHADFISRSLVSLHFCIILRGEKNDNTRSSPIMDDLEVADNSWLWFCEMDTTSFKMTWEIFFWPTGYYILHHRNYELHDQYLIANDRWS